jgi:hypothetical protein
MSKAMTKAERFFWSHAGFSYDAKVETKSQGRRKCATYLAEAEAWAEDCLTYAWEWDEYTSHEDLGCEEHCAREHEVYVCVAKYRDGQTAACLGGIADPDRNYRRVIEAELAAEAKHEAMAALLAAI